jgi:hypothetical protein
VERQVNVSVFRSVVRGSAVCLGVAVGTYAAYVATTWLRYGHPESGAAEGRDQLLDGLMPDYEVIERHEITVGAPASVTFAAAREMDLLDSPIVRAIIRARELALGAREENRPQPRGILAQTKAMGWGVLAETPNEIVMGAVTRPWEAKVVFRPLPPDRFIAFSEPDFVKIAWTLRADPVDRDHSIFRTETRVVCTDAAARAQFRRYWAIFSPGIKLIRWVSLAPLKREAEKRAKKGATDVVSQTEASPAH